MVHRDVEPRLHPLGHLAAAVGRERLEERRQEIRPAREDLVVDRAGGDDEALAAGARGLQAQEADHVDRVGVVLEPAAGLVVADVRVGDVEPEVLHVPEQMALRVLRARPAEVRADPHVGDRLLLARVVVDREAAQHEEAAAFEQLRAEAAERGAEGGEREVLRRHRRERPA